MTRKFFKINAIKVLFICSALISGLTFCAAADQTMVLTLEKARQTALENNPSIAAAMERIKQANESIAQARAGFFPSITASGGWNYTEKTLKSSPDYDETQHSGRLSVTQVLFNGFSTTYNLLAAKKGQEMNLAAHENEKRLLSWSVAQAFLNTQLAEESIKIALSDMAFNKNQESEAVAKEKAGLASYSDVLNFQTKVNTAAAALLSAQQDLAEAKTGLAALLGFKDAQLPEGISIAPLPDTISNTITQGANSSYEEILQSRPDLREASLAVQEADADINTAKASFYPTVSLTAGYGTGSGDHFMDESNMGASAGITVSMDIFSGGTKKAKLAQAKSRKRELEKKLENARINAVSNVKASALNIASLSRQLDLQKENTALIESARNLVEKEYRAGQASLVRLNEAQNDLVSAEGRLSTNKVSLLLALEELAYYSGKNFN